MTWTVTGARSQQSSQTQGAGTLSCPFAGAHPLPAVTSGGPASGSRGGCPTRRSERPILRVVLVCSMMLVLAGSSGTALAQWATQSFTLRPGWNAVFLEVDPTPAGSDALFAGLPVESVWDFNPTVDSPQFVQDPSTLIPGAPNWLSWFPPSSPLAGQGNLFILRDGRPYLIRVSDGAAPVTWTVVGRPSLRRITWRPGGVNFVGFRVGGTGPTFQTLFAGEAGLTGQPVYTLSSNGVWQTVANLSTTRPEAGKAYWVRCASPAKRTATVEVDAGSRLGLVFQSDSAESALRIRNASSSSRNVSLRLLPSASPPAGQSALAGPVPLEYWKTDYANVDLTWEAFPATLSFTNLPAGAEWNVRLGVRRAGLTAASGTSFQGLLEVADDAGTRWLIPVSAEASAASAVQGPLQTASDEASPILAGLWVGEAIINAVSQPAHPGDPNLARPAGGEFSFRLLLHVDTAGTSRLLQRVYVLRKPPTYVPDPQNPGFNLLDQPARTVVLTDESLIASVVGPGEVVGQRISSAAFSFGQPLVLAGGPLGSSTLSGVVSLDYNHPLNPFKHLYHPDHNNLDERFEQPLPEGKESFTVTRNLALEFTATDPQGPTPPGWGDTEVGGHYRETLAGLHRRPIHISGTFHLTRASTTGLLNDGHP